MLLKPKIDEFENDPDSLVSLVQLFVQVVFHGAIFLVKQGFLKRQHLNHYQTFIFTDHKS